MKKFDFDFLVDDSPVLIPDEGVQIEPEDVMSRDSAEDESGVMHPIRLREGVLKWTLSYAFLTHEEYRYIESLFKGKTQVKVKFRNLDGEPETRIAYRTKVPSIALMNRRTGQYSNYTLVLKEC